nr:MAG TPA: hypothetical protein [Caudoviricetes sp.]
MCLQYRYPSLHPSAISRPPHWSWAIPAPSM